jgi:hypothetical protein
MTITMEDIRLAIGNCLATVPNIGVIQPYERYAKTEKDFADLYLRKDGPQSRVRGWFIRRVTYRETLYLGMQTVLQYDWQIRGFMALQDDLASEIVMDRLVELVRYAFKQDLTLGGVAVAPTDANQPVGVQLAESGPVMFAGILCHGVNLTLTTTHADDLIPDQPAVLGDFRTWHANWDIPKFGNVLVPLPADATADATDNVTLPIS